MEVKKLLENYNKNKLKIAQKEYELRCLEHEIESIKAVVITGMPHGSNISNPTESNFIGKEEKMQKLKNEIECLEHKINITNKAINTQTAFKREILIMRFVEGQSIRKIADNYNKLDTSITRIISDSIDEIQAKM